MRAVTGLFCVIWIAFAAWPASADEPWTGAWDTRWRGGGARLVLQQKGGAIEGTYPLYGGKVAGTVNGRQFIGRWTEGMRSGGFVFALAPGGESFMGRYDSGEWWTGVRVSGAAAAGFSVKQDSPREAVRALVVAGNLARTGRPDELGKALKAIEFGPEDAGLLLGQKLDRARDLFAAIDETTFRIWSLPENAPDKSEAAVELKQAGTGAVLPLTARRGGDGKWRIVMPARVALDEHMGRLIQRHGGKPLPPDDYLKLKNPRAALRSFFEAMNAPDAEGRARAADVLDLSHISEPVRAHEGALASEYLKQILDRVGYVVYQEIPDDAASRAPYALFEHPAGKAVLAPIGEGKDTRWLFTADTVRDLRPLYAALEHMPSVESDLPPGVAGPSPFFVVRRNIGAFWPALLQPVGSVELWQLIGILLLGAAGFVAGWFLAPAALRALARRATAVRRSLPVSPVRRRAVNLGLERSSAAMGSSDVSGRVPAPPATFEPFLWPLRLLVMAALWYLGGRVLGLPETVEHVMHATIALLVAIGGIWAGVLVIDAVGGFYQRRALRTVTNLDDMLVSFVTGAAKIALVAFGAVYVADALGIPWQGIIAGLGIGGLAVAFASRETLSNIFGAGILLVDRPFKQGDWIGTEGAQGAVEQVGIRSTRIRTPQGALVVVPNGKLVDAIINNFGARRERLVRSNLAISYDTRPEQLEAFVAALRALPAAHGCLSKGRTEAGVWQLTENAIEVEFVSCIAASSMEEERAARQAVLLDILRLAERHGAAFAGAESAADELVDALDARHAKSDPERAAADGEAAHVKGPAIKPAPATARKSR